MYEILAIMAAIVFIYSIVSGGLDRTPVNGAIVFTAVGLVLVVFELGVLNVNVALKD